METCTHHFSFFFSFFSSVCARVCVCVYVCTHVHVRLSSSRSYDSLHRNFELLQPRYMSKPPPPTLLQDQHGNFRKDFCSFDTHVSRRTTAPGKWHPPRSTLSGTIHGCIVHPSSYGSVTRFGNRVAALTESFTRRTDLGAVINYQIWRRGDIVDRVAQSIIK